VVTPLPPEGPARRQRRRAVLCAVLTENPRWSQFCAVAREHGVDLDAAQREASRRFALPPSADWRPRGADAAEVVERDRASLRIGRGEPFVLWPLLRNAGGIPWRDRLLVRIGASVSSSLPFTPTALLVPDTAPGGMCELAVPGKAQWFPNLAVVSYVMVFPDGTPALPGRLLLAVDARDARRPDQTLPLPAGLAERVRRAVRLRRAGT
jgi:hypothetical protein